MIRLGLNEGIAYGGAIFVIGLLLGTVGNMDYEDELSEQAFYCEQVQAGHWPDYKGIAEEACDVE